MTSFQPSRLGRGLNVAEWEVSLVNRCQVASVGQTLFAGDCVAIDLTAASVALLANLGDGTNLDPFANAVYVVAGQTGVGAMAILAVANETIQPDKAGRFWIRHPCIEVNAPAGTAAGTLLTIGTDATAANNIELDTIATAETNLAAGAVAKFVAIGLEAVASGIARCVFDGYNGFGTYSATT